MNLAKIHNDANSLIADTYGVTEIPNHGSVIVSDDGKTYKVYFEKVESGWLITETKPIENL